MADTPEDRTHDEQVRRLTTDEDPRRGTQHRDYVYPVDLRPKKAKTRDREREERLRIKLLSHAQASD